MDKQTDKTKPGKKKIFCKHGYALKDGKCNPKICN
jgi:hypothetical protein